MRQVNSHRTVPIKFESQATSMLPGHGTGAKTPASNDASYLLEESGLKLIMSVAGNVVGGAIILTAMFNLPIILAVIWGL